MPSLKRLSYWFAAIVLLCIISVIGANYWVKHSTKAQLYTDVNAIPHNKVGLLLGCSKYLAHHWPNPYFTNRIQAAVALYKAGKIDYILVSGDNGTVYYDEATAMQQDLIAAGVPAERIVCDYAGFRTLDSIVRCRDVFGETAVTIISQQFHDERALFIANHKGMQAIAFVAQDIQGDNAVRLRERLARVKVVLDLWFNKQPKFGGAKVHIG